MIIISGCYWKGKHTNHPCMEALNGQSGGGKHPMPERLRKMLGDVNAPSAVALRNLIDTQSKDTIRRWSLDYAENKILPIFERIAPAMPARETL